MIDQDKLMGLVRDWLTAWNSKDIDRLMMHYADDVEFYSPTVIQRWGKPEGKLTGREAVRKHFLKGFEGNNHLQFELLGILNGVDAISLVYKKGRKGMAADVIWLDERGKVTRVNVYLSTWS